MTRKPDNYAPPKLTPTAFKRMTLSERIAALRDQKGINIEKLSETSGVGVGTIHAIESGGVKSSPGIDNVRRIAKALGIKFEDLVANLPPLAD